MQRTSLETYNKISLEKLSSYVLEDLSSRLITFTYKMKILRKSPTCHKVRDFPYRFSFVYHDLGGRQAGRQADNVSKSFCHLALLFLCLCVFYNSYVHVFFFIFTQNILRVCEKSTRMANGIDGRHMPFQFEFNEQ